MPEIDSFDFKTFLSNSTYKVFDTMLSMPLEAIDADQVQIPGPNKIVGSVGFAGDVIGCMNMHVDTIFAKTIAANMLGEEPENIQNEEVLDVVGELSNMIGGDVKSRLCDAKLPCSLSIPTTTSGNDFTVDSKGWTKHDRFAFRNNDHVALVEVFVKLNNQS